MRIAYLFDKFWSLYCTALEAASATLKRQRFLLFFIDAFGYFSWKTKSPEQFVSYALKIYLLIFFLMLKNIFCIFLNMRSSL